MEDKGKFLLFPLYCIDGLIGDAKKMDHIFDCGKYGYMLAAKKNTTFKQALTQAIYQTFEAGLKSTLPRLIKASIRANCVYDEGAPYFYPNGSFEIDDEFFVEYCEALATPIKEKILIWYKWLLTYNDLNLVANPDTIEYLMNKFNGEFKKGHPLIAVNRNAMFGLYKRMDDSTEEDRAEWALYFAALSKIGMKNYARTTKAELLCRMMGAKDQKTLSSILKSKGKNDIYNKYGTRRKFEKLREWVTYSFGVVFADGGRCLYISFNHTKEELIEIAKSEKKCNQKTTRRKKHVPTNELLPF